MKKPIATITENREISMPNMMLNMPNRISPMIPTTKLPAQKAMFVLSLLLQIMLSTIPFRDRIGRFRFGGFSKVRE